MFRIPNPLLVPASIAATLFALSACSAGSGQPVPLTPTQSAAAYSQFFAGQEGLTALGAVQNTGSCPAKFNAGCYTFSLSKGLKIGWCYGPSSDRCGNTKDYKWSGNVCLAKARRCKPIAQLKAKWTGPFKCTKKICTSKGFYELDTITKGSKPPKVTQQYVYKQQIRICGSKCVTYYIGINVSK